MRFYKKRGDPSLLLSPFALEDKLPAPLWHRFSPFRPYGLYLALFVYEDKAPAPPFLGPDSEKGSFFPFKSLSF